MAERAEPGAAPEDGVGEIERGVPLTRKQGGNHKLGPVARKLEACERGDSFPVASIREVKAAQNYAARKGMVVYYRLEPKDEYQYRVWRMG